MSPGNLPAAAALLLEGLDARIVTRANYGAIRDVIISWSASPRDPAVLPRQAIYN